MLAVAASIATFLVIGSYLGVLAHRYTADQSRATATAEGLVIEDAIGDEGDIRVRWTDADGRRHERRFGIYDTDRYVKGARFDVRFDPADPSGRPFPADPEETSGLDDLEVPIGLAGVGAVGFLVPWGWRGYAFRRVGRRPAVTTDATALRGETLDVGVLQFGDSCWLQFGDSTFQRVMWHPSFDAFRKGPLLVHGDLTGRRRVVVELPDGTRLVPIGRLRHKEPRKILLALSDERVVDRDELWLFPPGAVVPPARAWWRRPLLIAAVGAGIGAGMSMLFGSVTGIPAFAAAMAGFLVNVWALVGTEH